MDVIDVLAASFFAQKIDDETIQTDRTAIDSRV
jgi:hypothetical protein